ncbi:hypothetical protein BXZ70DRAFT_1034260 [Cristinia sonorae]|uniref:FAS1 domain-containing protein n=1 Tax=Cristinia sonorae TaxID=1940300 RepID=A0A8K0UJD0_9AGAR|nr:hypothetical protein BXZ70DRAFT_1034260 [Cristinia sonorae]
MSMQYEQEILAAPMDQNHYSPLTTTMPSLADLLTIESSASIFYSYAREVELSKAFVDLNGQYTLLVPTNKAVMALARKPHQGPAKPDTGIIIAQEEFDRQSKEYVEQWVSAHIIPSSVTLPSSETYDTMLDGVSITFKDLGGKEEPAWRRVVINDTVHIITAKEASNGVLYMIDGTVKID